MLYTPAAGKTFRERGTSRPESKLSVKTQGLLSNVHHAPSCDSPAGRLLPPH